MRTQLKERHTYIDGHKIAFREQGEGSPVILIHGIPTNSLMWRAIIPQLAKTHRVIAPDLLNYGQSAKPESADVSINAQSQMIVKLMDALGVRRADVVAHDIGGGVAQLIAVNYPEKAPKLAEAIPNAELFWIKDAGHWLVDEKPYEIGNQINQFLA